MAVCRVLAGIADTTNTSLLLKGLLLCDPSLYLHPLALGLSSIDLHGGNDVGHGGLTSTSDYVGGDFSDNVYSLTSLSDCPVFTFLTLTDNRRESILIALIGMTFVCK